jgi:hypothetical protein
MTRDSKPQHFPHWDRETAMWRQTENLHPQEPPPGRSGIELLRQLESQRRIPVEQQTHINALEQEVLEAREVAAVLSDQDDSSEEDVIEHQDPVHVDAGPVAGAGLCHIQRAATPTPNQTLIFAVRLWGIVNNVAARAVAGLFVVLTNFHVLRVMGQQATSAPTLWNVDRDIGLPTREKREDFSRMTVCPEPKCGAVYTKEECYTTHKGNGQDHNRHTYTMNKCTKFT